MGLILVGFSYPQMFPECLERDFELTTIVIWTGGLLRRDDEALHAPSLRQPECGQHQVGRKVPRRGGRAARRNKITLHRQNLDSKLTSPSPCLAQQLFTHRTLPKETNLAHKFISPDFRDVSLAFHYLTVIFFVIECFILETNTLFFLCYECNIYKKIPRADKLCSFNSGMPINNDET